MSREFFSHEESMVLMLDFFSFKLNFSQMFR